jgi:hypothetical protein
MRLARGRARCAQAGAPVRALTRRGRRGNVPPRRRRVRPLRTYSKPAKTWGLLHAQTGDRQNPRSCAVPKGWAQPCGRACLWLAQPQRTRHWPTTMPFIVWIARSASSCVLPHRHRASH